MDRNLKVNSIRGKVVAKVSVPETTSTRTVTLTSKPGLTMAANAAPTVRKEAPYKRLSEEEYRKRREKGLCFKCDEKYTAGHRCKNQQLRVFMVHDDELLTLEEEDRMEEVGETSGEIGKAVMCRLNTVVGLTTSGMIKIKGVM